MKLPRKLKKKIKGVFGKYTYYAIVKGYLILVRYKNNRGCLTKSSPTNTMYHSGTYHPYITFPILK